MFRQKSPKLFRDWINEHSLIQSQTLRILHFFLRIFDEFFGISRQIPEKSDAFCFFNQICENKLESCQTFWILWKIFTIIQNYSLVSLQGAAGRDGHREGWFEDLDHQQSRFRGSRPEVGGGGSVKIKLKIKSKIYSKIK